MTGISKVVNGMDNFQWVCRLRLLHWFKENRPEEVPRFRETYVVWSVKVLQNYKCLVSTSLPNTIYAEYTYNGDKGELYEDVYEKLTNKAITEYGESLDESDKSDV